MKKPDVAIIGYGTVGKAMHKLFRDALIYNGEKHRVGNLTYIDINTASYVFVCVPTPTKKDGSCDISIVEDVVSHLKNNLIILRSTVIPGTTDYLAKKYNKRIVFCPEYVGETVDHPLSDETTRSFLILGGKLEDTKSAVHLFQRVYNASVKIRQLTSLEAEVAKYLENRHIAFKVAECNEAYDFCEKIGVDYHTVREAVYQDDPRMSPYWTFVYPGNRGFETKCIPKDVEALVHKARQVGVPMEITEKILTVNKKWRAKK